MVLDIIERMVTVVIVRQLIHHLEQLPETAEIIMKGQHCAYCEGHGIEPYHFIMVPHVHTMYETYYGHTSLPNGSTPKEVVVIQ